ncbi:hypothetical protein I0C86_04145 [Plantactinospora sp. S1510]|uniref:WXG100 family type VII secretion target n=1 Tax=Plantactinospora alkalitolerans TaxID=2789879 RepID=A0ABS0GQK5_9ACTN|nr:hypothetical protein [Plantactinospora alkalitolerans]MBF9128187.1 hypothetical protein [Plantactinospora alkalitolerans]
MTAVGAGWWERESEQLLNDASDGMERVQQLTVELADGLTDLLRRLPLGIGAGAIERVWQEFLEIKDRIFDEMQQYLTSPGYPAALFRIGEYWDMKVGAPVSSLSQKISAYGMEVDNDWSGSAASAYRDSAEAQARAIATIKPLTEKIQNVLTDLGHGIIAFWVALVAAFISFVVGMIGAVGLLAGGVTAPGAPIDALATAGAVVGLITAAVLALREYAERIDKSMITIQQALSDNGGMVERGGTFGWPSMDSSGSWSVRTD